MTVSDNGLGIWVSAADIRRYFLSYSLFWSCLSCERTESVTGWLHVFCFAPSIFFVFVFVYN